MMMTQDLNNRTSRCNSVCIKKSSVIFNRSQIPGDVQKQRDFHSFVNEGLAHEAGSIGDAASQHRQGNLVANYLNLRVSWALMLSLPRSETALRAISNRQTIQF